MTRISKRDAIAEQRKLIRELRTAAPVNAVELVQAVRHLKWLRAIGKPVSAKHAKRIAVVQGTLETLLKPFVKPGMNPALWAQIAESVVAICNQQRRAVNARHNKPGASHDKGEAMRTAWATAKWTTRDKCAEEYGPKVGLKFTAARRHLRGT